MNKTTICILTIASFAVTGCTPKTQSAADELHAGSVDPFWRNASIYFIMTDRFNNGDPSNDRSVGRAQDGGVLRDFRGGDIRGITQKIESGYFDKLGVDAIWTTPLIEQIHGAVEERDYGKTYAYHGYWPKDWTAVDPNFGTEAELREMIEAAHARGIRVIADVIINHTGPVTALDDAWPADWVRQGPACRFNDYANNVGCNLAETLPDLYTESDGDVELPDFLTEKWRREGRLDTELRELDTFFDRTGYPRAPRYYVMKWLTDWVRDYGIDGFRVDTAKHVEAQIWRELRTQAEFAFDEWRKSNPDNRLDGHTFFMFGEVFNYGVEGFSNTVEGGRAYDYGDRQVDFYDYGFHSLINMGFPAHAVSSPERLFSGYSDELNTGPFDGRGIVSYITSHDDQNPFDRNRTATYESATKLMLAPGAVQIYYGDEVARDLTIDGTTGDATLRSEFDWATAHNEDKAELLAHWRKLGRFRKAHPSVGAGVHEMLDAEPYVFSRTLREGSVDDRVLVGLGLATGLKEIPSHRIFPDDATLRDYYSNSEVAVREGKISLDTPYTIVLLGRPAP